MNDHDYYITEEPERKRGQHLQREERGAIQRLSRMGWSLAGKQGGWPNGSRRSHDGVSSMGTIFSLVKKTGIPNEENYCQPRAGSQLADASPP